jgi:hypothetical protein
MAQNEKNTKKQHKTSFLVVLDNENARMQECKNETMKMQEWAYWAILPAHIWTFGYLFVSF